MLESLHQLGSAGALIEANTSLHLWICQKSWSSFSPIGDSGHARSNFQLASRLVTVAGVLSELYDHLVDGSIIPRDRKQAAVTQHLSRRCNPAVMTRGQFSFFFKMRNAQYKLSSERLIDTHYFAVVSSRIVKAKVQIIPTCWDHGFRGTELTYASRRPYSSITSTREP